MVYQVQSYLQFLVKSSNQHGVHSPFIYDLITKCFYTKTNDNQQVLITNYRNKLLQNPLKIEVTDFGKGSKIFKDNHREIAKIVKVAGISKKRSKLLIRLISYFSPSAVLEIGTSLGVGTASIYLGNPKSSITTLEGCFKTTQVAKDQFKQFKNHSVNFVVGDFKETLPKVLNNKTYDFIYFDGNHQKQPTLNYFNQCLNTIHNDTVFIFDDIHWSKEMTEAWEQIKQHPKVTATIDTYFWGFVFFRKEQPKEHFIIRV